MNEIFTIENEGCIYTHLGVPFHEEMRPFIRMSCLFIINY